MLCSLVFATGAVEQAYAKRGCGPGPLVMDATVGHKGALRQSIGFSTNATFLPIHTLAITFGTSGCSSGGLVQKEFERRQFVAVNLDALGQEMAQGQGDSLNALASLMGCSAETHGEFGRMTQSSYEVLFNTETPEPAQFVSDLRKQMVITPALQSCDPLG